MQTCTATQRVGRVEAVDDAVVRARAGAPAARAYPPC
jgi:hypothetical protein